MFATVELNGNLIDITNEFCRFLNTDRKEVLTNSSKFLTHNNEEQNHEIIMTLMSGKT